MNNFIIVLMGLPGSGKSTFCKNFLSSLENIEIISNDLEILKIAEKLNLTYDETFKKISFSEIKKNLNISLKNAINNKKNIIIDNTNLKFNSRRKFTSIQSYKKIGILFSIDEDLLIERLHKRSFIENKTIPNYVLTSMIENFEKPKKYEFDYFFKFDNNFNIKDLEKCMNK